MTERFLNLSIHDGRLLEGKLVQEDLYCLDFQSVVISVRYIHVFLFKDNIYKMTTKTTFAYIYIYMRYVLLTLCNGVLVPCKVSLIDFAQARCAEI